jgi:ATP-dependent DNA helicase RecQ
MERYASGPRCRHRALVEYFGEAYEPKRCGACDWCLEELQPLEDSFVVAQKILSCVARVKQAWGIAHVTDVLVGRRTDKVVASGHADLSTFGLLSHEPAAAVRGFIEQLVGEGLLTREGDPYPVVRLTGAGAALLKGAGGCSLFRERQPAKAKSRRTSPAEVLAGQTDLFQALRDLRLQLARERGVPPYVIFHDTTLRDLANRRPQTMDELHDIYGIGTRKAADFGERFLEAIRRASQAG